MKKPNFELLKDAYAIIDGIPDAAINLARIVSKGGRKPSCGTIACAAGWLGFHPKMRAAGLKTQHNRLDNYYQMTYRGEHDAGAYVYAMSEAFGLGRRDASELFNGRQSSEKEGDFAKLSDKQIWLRRVREFLKQHNQLSCQQ